MILDVAREQVLERGVGLDEAQTLQVLQLPDAEVDAALELAHEARLDEPVTPEMLYQTEQRSVALQLSRLMQYPMVRDGLEQGRLAVPGWHYIIERGEVLFLDVERGEFVGAT